MKVMFFITEDGVLYLEVTNYMKKCPVCELAFPNPVPAFCPKCGWDIKNDPTIVPSLGEIPEAVLEEYKQRLSLSRKNWQHYQRLDDRIYNIEDQLRAFQKRLSLLELPKESSEIEQKIAKGKTIHAEISNSLKCANCGSDKEVKYVFYNGKWFCKDCFKNVTSNK